LSSFSHQDSDNNAPGTTKVLTDSSRSGFVFVLSQQEIMWKLGDCLQFASWVRARSIFFDEARSDVESNAKPNASSG